MNQPLITVIIPVRNSEKTIVSALDSIVHQTYKNLEILVVDDFSEDNTVTLVEAYAKSDTRITCLRVHEDDPHRIDSKLNRNINAGYSARNFGFRHAHGDYITFQDADDISLLNRIEIQYDLITKHSATHVTVDWFQLKEEYAGKKFDFNTFVKENGLESKSPHELYALSQTTKGFISKISIKLNKIVPFYIKRKKFVHKLFFGSLAPYPGTGNSPLFKREVIDKVQFRPLSGRIWPSFMGRGADRDFNFQVAETFRNSYVFFLPLYMWRQKEENKKYSRDVRNYIINP